MTPIRPTDSGSPDPVALLRYLSGQSPLPESEAIRAWLAADPDRQASIAELQAAWSVPPPVTPAWDRAGVWERLGTELPAVARGDEARDAQGESRPGGLRATAVRRHWRAAARWAAVVLVVAGVGGAWLSGIESEQPVGMREHSTAPGQRSVIDLADGTRVTLDAGTRLRVPVDLGAAHHRLHFWRARSPRRLELVGRALFEVRHDAARPFVVETATASTEDLGTAFVIDAYPESHTTKVAVIEGTVALRERAPSIHPRSGAHAPPRGGKSRPLMTLTAGDVATLAADGRTTRVRAASMRRHTAWTRGELEFEDTPLRDVLAELNRRYGSHLRAASPELAERRITVRIRSEDDLMGALYRVGGLLDLKGMQRGPTMLLAPRSSPWRVMTK